jgi:poly(3-hydroxybutyrate) depolymerase
MALLWFASLQHVDAHEDLCTNDTHDEQMYVTGMSTGAFLAVAFAARRDLHPEGGLAGCVALACVDDIP